MDQLQGLQRAIDAAREKVTELKRNNGALAVQGNALQAKMAELGYGAGDVVARNRMLQREVDNLTKENSTLRVQNQAMQEELAELHRKNERQHVIDGLHCGKVEPTHRNILYGDKKGKTRLPVCKHPVRGGDQVGSLAFGACFAVQCRKDDGGDVWLQIQGGDFANQWVLGCDAGTVNCVDMTKYDCEKYRGRIHSSEYAGQDFPRNMYTEGCVGSKSNNLCLISASKDSFWREVNIEMLFRGIAAATISEEADAKCTDWVTSYAVNCVQYGQLRTAQPKQLLVTVKPSSRWRDYQPGCCHGPDLEKVRDDIGKAQYEECCWLKSMEEQLQVKWERVAFLTGLALLRAHCAWTQDDCRRAANDRLLWTLREFFGGGCKEGAAHELECAYWLWDEAFDGCAHEEVLARATAYAELRQRAKMGWKLEIPDRLRAAGAAPPWVELTAAFAAEQEARVATAAAAGRLAAGGKHSVWLDAAGTLRTWGDNSEGQCSTPTLAPGESWVAVSAGWKHTLGLTASGRLHTWGSNASNQCSVPAVHGERWVSMSAGAHHSLGLTASGALYAWGDNGKGQCDVPTLPTGERWAAASAGVLHSLGLTVSGELHTWGGDAGGQCSGAPVLPTGERWIAVSAGSGHSLGLTAAGELHAWGDDYQRRCSGAPSLAAGEHWVAVSAGAVHSLGLTSAGALHAWGRHNEGQRNVPAEKGWLAASAGTVHSLGLTSAGVVRAWGEDDGWL